MLLQAHAVFRTRTLTHQLHANQRRAKVTEKLARAESKRKALVAFHEDVNSYLGSLRKFRRLLQVHEVFKTRTLTHQLPASQRHTQVTEKLVWVESEREAMVVFHEDVNSFLGSLRKSRRGCSMSTRSSRPGPLPTSCARTSGASR